MPYTPHTQQDVKDMLKTIGLNSEEELFLDIPDELKTKNIDIEDGLDEFSVYQNFKKISKQNREDRVLFMGGGYYDHVIPSAVDSLALRSEFYTAYTPYQAEASQGTLQVLYEYQSLICNLTGMEVSNATMYDGGTALAEAILMAVRITKRDKVVIDGTLNPDYIKIIKTYLSCRDIDVVITKNNKDKSDFNNIKSLLDENVAGYVYQNPNFFGTLQDFTDISKTLKEKKILTIASVYPISLGIVKTPAAMGADIVSGDGQCLGNYLNFGGPSFGFLATKKEYIRELPGRIIGKSIDKNNNEIFVLTMQAREQHIRRGRATSNICSNQNLLALRATIFLSLLGKNGFIKLAQTNYNKSEYLKNRLKNINGIKIYNNGETFNEFVIHTDISCDDFLLALKKNGFYGGINLKNLFKKEFSNMTLITTTEKRTKKEIDDFVKNIEDIL